MKVATNVQTNLLGKRVTPAMGFEHLWPFIILRSNGLEDLLGFDDMLPYLTEIYPGIFTYSPVAKIAAVYTTPKGLKLALQVGAHLKLPEENYYGRLGEVYLTNVRVVEPK